MSTKIYHNPKCSKSREALQILEEKLDSFETIKYLDQTPSFEELKKIIELLNIAPLELIRKKEEIFEKNFKNKNFTDDEWINIMVENPKLIERPIIIHNNQAIIGRPPQKIYEIL